MRQDAGNHWCIFWRSFWRTLLALTVLVALLVGVRAASANGVPVDIYLSYLPRESNWGPQDAQGKAHVAVADGSIRLDVAGLKPLQGEHYTIWMESRGERELFAVGQFNADAKGEGHFAADLDVPNQEYRMLFLSVEKGAAGRLETQPDARRSLAGMFPNKVLTPAPFASPGAAGSATASAQAAAGGAPLPGQAATAGGNPAAGESLSRPPYLPVTGVGDASGNAFLPVLAVALALTGAQHGALGIRHLKTLRRRK